jgi:DNA-binding MarR family transcriptional regulator
MNDGGVNRRGSLLKRCSSGSGSSIRTSGKPHPLEDNVGVRIARLAEIFARLARTGVEAPWGLRQTDLRILNILDGAERMLISEIARRTHVDKAWISRSVSQLAAKGLVERRRHPGDSRASLAVLTEKGRAMLDQIRPFVAQHECRVLDGIESKRFKMDLDRLLSNAEAILEAVQAMQRCR